MEGPKDGYISKDGKLVLDFLQAIHAAEKRQADLDARVFNEEKKMLKVWLITITCITYITFLTLSSNLLSICTSFIFDFWYNLISFVVLFCSYQFVHARKSMTKG